MQWTGARAMLDDAEGREEAIVPEEDATVLAVTPGVWASVPPEGTPTAWGAAHWRRKFSSNSRVQAIQLLLLLVQKRK